MNDTEQKVLESATDIARAAFEKLVNMNVNDYTETKTAGGVDLTYLSWAWAWKLFKTENPCATYTVRHWDGKPYFYDENLGYMVETEIDDGNGLRYMMWLPVMNGANKAMKDKPYTYSVKNWKTGATDEKTVEPATMFDINTAIMRCLVKNIGMFGLGLYIYAGEDLPDGETVRSGDKAKGKPESKPKNVGDIVAGIESSMTLDNAKRFYARAIENFAKGTPEYKIWVDAWVKKKDELEMAVGDKLLAEAEETINSF